MAKNFEKDGYGLYEYGIMQYEADFEIHISSIHAFFFPISEGRNIVNRKIGKERYVTVKYKAREIITACGRIPPFEAFCELQRVKIPEHIKEKIGWPPSKWDDESLKGRLAKQIADEMLKEGYFKIPMRRLGDVTRKGEQILGKDQISWGTYVFQTKCDLPADYTGNLFIQTHECNPFGKY